jgi:hypothetical protein
MELATGLLWQLGFLVALVVNVENAGTVTSIQY